MATSAGRIALFAMVSIGLFFGPLRVDRLTVEARARQDQSSTLSLPQPPRSATHGGLPSLKYLPGDTNRVDDHPIGRQVGPPAPSQSGACGRIWSISILETPPPEWLTTPRYQGDLQTHIPYTFLAGQLIQNGLVSASSCASGGLQSPGIANTCGLEKARVAVDIWQNQFDSSIYQAALKNDIPAVLLKKIVAQESQFWPGNTPDQVHYGLGHVTEVGLDTFFLWDKDEFYRVCRSVFAAEKCSTYANLSTSEKGILRGYYLSHEIDISCPTCVNRFDIGKSSKSFDFLARLLISNCQQVSRLIYNQTGAQAGTLSSFVDLWLLTLANYNVGSGCVGDAVGSAFNDGNPLDWVHISDYFEGQCKRATTYILKITE